MPLKFREEFQLLNCCLISASAFAHLSGAGCPSPTLSRRLGASADTYHICLWGHLWSTSTCLVTFMLMKAWPSHLGVWDLGTHFSLVPQWGKLTLWGLVRSLCMPGLMASQASSLDGIGRSPRECWPVSQDNHTVRHRGEEHLKCRLGRTVCWCLNGLSFWPLRLS